MGDNAEGSHSRPADDTSNVVGAVREGCATQLEAAIAAELRLTHGTRIINVTHLKVDYHSEERLDE